MLCLMALAMPLNSTRPKIWSQLDVTIVRPPPCLSDNLNNHLSSNAGMKKMSYLLYEGQHTQQQHSSLNKSSHSLDTVLSPQLQSQEWHLLVIQWATRFHHPALYCHNPWHPLKRGFKSCDLLHLICKLGWTVSELIFAVWFVLSWLSLCYLVFHFEYQI